MTTATEAPAEESESVAADAEPEEVEMEPVGPLMRPKEEAEEPQRRRAEDVSPLEAGATALADANALATAEQAHLDELLEAAKPADDSKSDSSVSASKTSASKTTASKSSTSK